MTWLGDARDPPAGTQEVLKALLTARSKAAAKRLDDVAEYALTWLGDPHSPPAGAHEVLRGLFSLAEPPDPAVQRRIADYANAWLETGETSLGHQEVLKALLSNLERLEPETARRTIDNAMDWLGDAAAPPPGVQEVLKVLFSVFAQLAPDVQEKAIAYAIAWLGEPGDAPAGAQEVLKALLRNLNHLPEELHGPITAYLFEWLGDPKKAAGDVGSVFMTMASNPHIRDAETDAFLRNWGLQCLRENGAKPFAGHVAIGLSVFGKNDPEVRSLLVEWATGAPHAGALKTFLANGHRLGPDPDIRRLAEERLAATEDPREEVSILQGLAFAYPDDAEVTERMFSHLRVAAASLGPQICAGWFRRVADPAAALAGMLAQLGKAPSVSSRFTVAIALASNQDRLLESLPVLNRAQQATAIDMLRLAVLAARDRLIYARELAERADRWPPVHAARFLCILLSSSLPTAHIVQPLLEWLKVHEGTSSRELDDVLAALAENPGHFTALQEHISQEMALALLRRRLQR
jgi:hypothetical protein